jgi:4'-phosphopantetheinyl transferase
VTRDRERGKPSVMSSSFQCVPHEFSSDVQLWRVDLDAYAEGLAPDGLRADELERMARMRLARDAARYLASRHALRHVLAGTLDCSPRDLILEADEFGKPQLVHGGRLHFNLSHSERECLIGVSLHSAIGVDIEALHKVVDADALARAHFTQDEHAEWSRAAADLRDRTFLACWTRKEACLKALGVGLSAKPASIEVGCGPEVRVVTIPFGSRRCELTLGSLQLPGGSIAAVAVTAPETSRTARQFFRRQLPPASRRSVDRERA